MSIFFNFGHDDDDDEFVKCDQWHEKNPFHVIPPTSLTDDESNLLMKLRKPVITAAMMEKYLENFRIDDEKTSD